MSRWKVECGFWWVAMQVDKQGREIPGTAKRFPTHAEAMAYADQRARTIEVTLPRLTALPTRRHIVQHNGLIIEYARSSSHPNIPPGHIDVDPEERRPLAAALLALAQHKEEA